MAFVLPPSRSGSNGAPTQRRAPSGKEPMLTYVIGLRRLEPLDGVPGLIEMTVEALGAPGPAPIVGSLTDAALRGRLGHSGTHSTNDIAAIRQALADLDRPVTLHESWLDRTACLLFWSGFGGLQIRRLTWKCAGCGAQVQENIGASVGESIPRRCRCGKVTRITMPKFADRTA